MFIQKKYFFSILFLIVNLTVITLYTGLKDYDIITSHDAYNYFNGFQKLRSHPFNIEESALYFGRYPELIFPYLLSLKSFFVNPVNVNEFMFFITIIIGMLAFFTFSKVHHLNLCDYTHKTKGLIILLLSAQLPIGLTVQLTRQSFAFFVFLALLIILRRMKFSGEIISAIALPFTHLSSSMLPILNYFIKRRNINGLIIFCSLLLILLPYFLTKFTHLNGLDYNFIERIEKIDKYAVVTLFLTIYIGGFNFFKHKKNILFLLLILLYILISSNSVITRIFFGFGWFWLLMLALNCLGPEILYIRRFRIYVSVTALFVLKLSIVVSTILS